MYTVFSGLTYVINTPQKNIWLIWNYFDPFYL